MQKTVKAVQPYIHPGLLNFKQAPYEAWKSIGGKVANPHYPTDKIKGVLYKCDLPSIYQNKEEARLRFVEPLSIGLDTFPDYITHEVIPFIWDCWPFLYEKTCKWFKKHKVQTAIFTCKETVDYMQKQFPEMNIMHCPEGIDSAAYHKGESLANRELDVLEFGRPLFKYVKTDETNYNLLCNSINHVRTGALTKRPNDEELHRIMANAKVTVCYPHCITEPEWCGGVETLTQRYWECMLSRMVIIGHAPKELIDLIGYNPCLEADFDGNSLAAKIREVLGDISSYQTLVDKNRDTAELLSDWTIRMREVQNWLSNCGYKI